jgi:hypothetical protein
MAITVFSLHCAVLELCLISVHEARLCLSQGLSSVLDKLQNYFSVEVLFYECE